MSYSTESDVQAAIAENRTWFMILGILMIILGVVAVIYPLTSTIASAIFFGWLLLIGGVVQVVHAFSNQKWSGFFYDLLIGILYILVGAWLAFYPASGSLSLTFVLAAAFIAQGILEVIMSFKLKPLDGWGWVLFSGVMAVIAGVLIFANFPSSAAWAIGLLTGINLISSGWAYLFLGMAAGDSA